MIQKVSIDMQLPFSYVDEELVHQLTYLAPFGKGNSQPIFAQKEVEILGHRITGKNRNVMLMDVRDESGTVLSAVIFGDVEAFRTYFMSKPNRKVAITYYPRINDYLGGNELQLVIQNYQ